MPMYHYTCKECGLSFTKFLRRSKRNMVKCPMCKSRKLERFGKGEKRGVDGG